MVDPPPLIRPTPGPVRHGFRYDRARPFAAGQRRGTTFAARAGAPVVAPCRGRVTFAGRTPRGPGVTVRCGTWTATVLGTETTVRAGTTVTAGATVGRASGAVGLSLRPVADRWGYVDPRPALARPRTGTPLGPAPRVPSPRPAAPRRPGIASRRAPLRALRPVSDPAAVRHPSFPVGAWPALPVESRSHGSLRIDRRAVAVGIVLALGPLTLLALGPLARQRRRRSRRRPASRGTVPVTERSTRLWTDARAAVPSIGNGLLRHHPDLLRQRRATPRARVLDDRR